LVTNVIYEDLSSLGSPRQSELISDSAEVSERQSKAIIDEKNSLSITNLQPRKSSILTNESCDENDEMDDREKNEQTLKKKLKKKTALAKQ
jgi:hypothetical protein